METLLPDTLGPLAQYLPSEAAIGVAAIAVSVALSIMKRFFIWINDLTAERIAIGLSFLVVAGMHAHQEGWMPYLDDVAVIGIGGALVWIASTKIGYGVYKLLDDKGYIPHLTDDEVKKERVRTGKDPTPINQEIPNE